MSIIHMELLLIRVLRVSDVRGVHDDLAGRCPAPLITVPAVLIVELPLGVSVVPAGTPVHEASGICGQRAGSVAERRRARC